MNLEIVNFEELGFVELNAQELQEVEGGGWPGIGWYMDVAFSCSFDFGGSSRLPEYI